MEPVAEEVEEDNVGRGGIEEGSDRFGELVGSELEEVHVVMGDVYGSLGGRGGGSRKM